MTGVYCMGANHNYYDIERASTRIRGRGPMRRKLGASSHKYIFVLVSYVPPGRHILGARAVQMLY
jgi:hypothetical protein